MMNINPGELNKKIQIVRKNSNSRDADGYPMESIEVIRECYAKFTQQSGSEIQKNESEFANAKTRFLVRHSSIVINTDMHVLYSGRSYDIQYINTYGDNGEYTELWCQISERV